MRRWAAALSVAAILSLSSPVSAAHRPWYYPLLKLGPAVYHRFEFCVLPGQSRSSFAHPNTKDNSRTGSSGLFQFENGPHQVWWRWAPVAGVRTPLWRATPYEQALVAATVYKHDGMHPWAGC